MTFFELVINNEQQSIIIQCVPYELDQKGTATLFESKEDDILFRKLFLYKNTFSFFKYTTKGF